MCSKVTRGKGREGRLVKQNNSENCGSFKIRFHLGASFENLVMNLFGSIRAWSKYFSS